MKQRCKIISGLIMLAALSGGGLLYGAKNAHAACANPVGQPGEVVMNTTHNVPQYCDTNDNWIAMSGGTGDVYMPNAVEFDGTSNYLDNAAGLSGVIDGKQGTLSVWFRLDGSTGSDQHIIRNATARFIVEYDDSRQEMRIWGENGSNVNRLDLATANFNGQMGQWHHLLASWDLTDPTRRHIYINGVEDEDTVSSTNHIDGVIQYSNPFWRIGAAGPSNQMINGQIADLWFDTGTYIDLSVQANREQFIDSSGNPVYLGADGSLPTGSSPDIFLSGDTANWHTNKGTGGGFTENGTLTTAATIPYNDDATQIVPSGLVGYYRMDETTGTTIYDSSGNGNTGTMLGTLDAASDSVPGKIGRAINFLENGAADRITIADTGLPTNPSQPFSMGAWFKLEEQPIQSAGRWTLGWGDAVDGTNDAQIMFDRDANAISYQVGDGSGGVFVSNYIDKWMHVYLTYDGTSARLYQNGVLLRNDPVTTFNPVSSNGVIGARIPGSGGGDYNGDIDEVRFYNRALTDAEIMELYKARDGIRYNESHKVAEYFDGNKWTPMTPAWPEVDEGPIYGPYEDLGCATIGDTCSTGGSIYAGTINGAPAYMTTAAFEGQTTWSSTFETASGLTSTTDGKTNTQTMVGSGLNFEAAEYCNSLDAHDKQDWFLPSEDETDLFWNGGTPIGGVLTDGSYYWSTTEFDATRARGRNYNSGAMTQTAKANSLFVRCIRTGTQSITGTGGLVGHWKLDETEGTIAVDSSGNGNDGTMNGSLDAANDTTSGAIGTALDFDNIDDYISVADPGANSVFDFDTGDTIAISAWIKPVTLNGLNVIIGKDPVVLDSNYMIFLNDDGFRFTYKNSGVGITRYEIPNLITTENWQHIALTYTFGDAASIKVYRNANDETASGSWSFGDGTDSPMITDGDLLIGFIGTTYWQGGLDDIRMYDRALSTAEVTQLYQMGAPVGSSTALPQGCPNIGDVCDDGTIYAGLSPDGSVAMFTTPADAPDTYAWNNGNTSNTVDTSMANCTDNSPGTATTCQTGEANTLLLVTEDSDSGTTGVQPHQAAAYCYDLTAHGQTDWYLPAQDELNVLYTNRDEGALSGTLNGSGSFGTLISSSENASTNVRSQLFANAGIQANANKYASVAIRCVRKGPAPRCANPYGLKGTIAYNTTHDVMQYCDGARWIAIGKRE